jgi:hypothetical protein
MMTHFWPDYSGLIAELRVIPLSATRLANPADISQAMRRAADALEAEVARLTAALAGARQDTQWLWAALYWLDNHDPELVAAAEAKFGIEMASCTVNGPRHPTTEPAKAEEP